MGASMLQAHLQLIKDQSKPRMSQAMPQPVMQTDILGALDSISERFNSKVQVSGDEDAAKMKLVPLNADQAPVIQQPLIQQVPSARVNSYGNPIRRRRKRSAQEIEILEERFQLGPNWDYDTFESMALRLNISKQKVYKWRWERVKKEAVRLGQDPLLA